MFMSTRLDGSPTHTRTTLLPPLVAAQPPVGNQPSAELHNGPLARLGKRLRITPNGVNTVFFNALEQKGDTARGLRLPAGDTLRRPDPAAAVPKPAAAIGRRTKRVVAATGGAALSPPPTGDNAGHRSRAAIELRQRFSGPGAGPLVGRLLALSGAPPLPYEQPLLIGTVLAQTSRGDAAVAGRLLDDLMGAEPVGVAYAMQRALAVCGGPGIDCLLALHPLHELPADPLLAAVRRDAFAARWRAAEAVHRLLPPSLQPRSLAECVRLAAMPDGALAAHPLLANGLACAQRLVDDPAADAPTAERFAYLALRNGITTPGQLQRAQDRLFKINTYIERASETGATRAGHAVQRVFGYQKSPLHALTQLGSAQSKTRHPEDDLASRTAVMNAFAERLDQHLVGQRQTPAPDDTTLRRAIHVATVRFWKTHIVDRGWQDELPVGRAVRAAIAREVAGRMGCPPALVRAHPALGRLRSLRADTLAQWSRQEAIDPLTPAGADDPRSYGTALARFLELHRNGDTVFRRPTVAQTRQCLRDAIADTRQTYSFTAHNGATLGLQGSVIDLLALTPVLAGVGPSVAALGTRGAYLLGGSNVHGGQLLAASQRGGRFEMGLVAFVGKRLGDSVNAGLTWPLMPVQLEHTRTQGTVLRTRMNVIGSDKPTAWMDLLLEAYDTITGHGAEAGAPVDAERMWAALASRLYKNPSFSIDDLEAQQSSAGGSATSILAVRTQLIGGVQAGPAATVGFSKVYRNRLRQKDAGANRSTEQNAESAGHSGNASVGLTGLAPAINGGAIHAHAGQPGASQALTLTSASLGAAGVTFLRSAAGATLRMVTDQGRIDADYTVMDTETADARSFAEYIDSCRPAWLAALGGGEAAEHELDVFLTRLLAEEKRSNVTYGERRRMTPLAARRIDHFRALAAVMRQAGGPLKPGAAKEIEQLEGEVSRVLNDPASWDPRSLWVLDLNQSVSGKGLSIILQLVSRKAVSAPRQRAMLVARQAPNRLPLQPPAG
jgi:hypothetical protein